MTSVIFNQINNILLYLSTFKNDKMMDKKNGKMMDKKNGSIIYFSYQNLFVFRNKNIYFVFFLHNI